jgi:hypothetical protein
MLRILLKSQGYERSFLGALSAAKSEDYGTLNIKLD